MRVGGGEGKLSSLGKVIIVCSGNGVGGLFAEALAPSHPVLIEPRRHGIVCPHTGMGSTGEVSS